MSRSRIAHGLACLSATGALLLAALACSTSGTGPDAVATVEALNYYVRQTLAAQTGLPPTSPADTPTDTAVAKLPPLPLHTSTPLPASPEPPTPLPASPAPAPTAAELARPNGQIYHVVYAPRAPVIDGDLGEWNPMPYQFSLPVYKPENWVDASDNSVSFNLAWNQQYLFLAAIVLDDVHVQTQHREMIYLGDSLEILLDADLAGDFTAAHLNADDYQLGLSPGALNGDAPEAYLWFPADLSGPNTTVVLSAQPEGQGYRLEAAIPWAIFNITPAGNTRFGFALSASDNDSPGTAEQQSMISTVGTRKLLDPASWGTLDLDNP